MIKTIADRTDTSTVIRLIAGFAIVGALIYFTDASQVLSALKKTGPWMIVLMFAHLGFMVILTKGWKELLDEAGIHTSFPSLFRLRWIANGVNALTPFTAADGELVRGYLQIREGNATEQQVVGVIAVELTARLLSLVIFIIAGLVILAIGTGGDTVPKAFAAVGVLIVLLAVFIFVQQKGWLVHVYNKLLGAILNRNIDEHENNGQAMQEVIQGLYRGRWAFIRSALWHFLAWLFGVAEILFILYILNEPLGFFETWIFEAISQAVRNVGFFLPASLGAQEGGYLIGATAVGATAAFGVSIAIIKRIRDILVGLPAIALWYWKEFWRRFK